MSDLFYFVGVRWQRGTKRQSLCELDSATEGTTLLGQETAILSWGQPAQIVSSLSPKGGGSLKRVTGDGVMRKVAVSLGGS